MLINLNGKIVNYNNVQSVAPQIVHVDFIENTVEDHRGNRYFEITVQPKISFTIDVLDPTGRSEAHEFHLEMNGRSCDTDDVGETSHSIRNGLTPLPLIGCDLASGTFHYWTGYPKKAWMITRQCSFSGDAHYDQPSSEEIKAFKNTMQAKIRQGLPLALLKAVNHMARECRKA